MTIKAYEILTSMQSQSVRDSINPNASESAVCLSYLLHLFANIYILTKM